MDQSIFHKYALLAAGATAITACSQPQRPEAAAPAAVVAGPTTPQASDNPPPAAEPAPSGAPSANPKSPMTATLLEPSAVAASGEVELGVEVWRVKASLAPIKISLVLPAGAQLAAGAAEETIADTQAQSLKRTWRVRYATLPSADAKVIVDWQTDAAGFHSELEYRFGRPAPKRAEPPRLPEVRLPGGQSLGRPILTGGDGK